MKTGLVLEGGAMRGMYTAGVLDVMMENNITVDGTIGVSAGATFGCNFKSKQIGRTIRYNLKYSKDPRYVGIRSLIKTGDLYGADFCYRQLPEKLDVFDIKTYKKPRKLLTYQRFLGFSMEATPGFEPGIRVLQTRALPLGYVAEY